MADRDEFKWSELSCAQIVLLVLVIAFAVVGSCVEIDRRLMVYSHERRLDALDHR